MERSGRVQSLTAAVLLAALLGGCGGGGPAAFPSAPGVGSQAPASPDAGPPATGSAEALPAPVPPAGSPTATTPGEPSDPTAQAGGTTASGVLTPKEVYARNVDATVQVLAGDGGSGSGFVIDAAEGIVVSNAHVTGGVGPLSVMTSGGDRVPARRLGVSPCDDLAVLQLNTVPRGLTQVVLGDSSALQSQDQVTAIGFPASFDAATDGSRTAVSSSGNVQVPRLDAAPHSSLPLYTAAIQHDAAINPGNSGGPLFNDRGEVVGVNSLVNTEQGGRTIQGQAYAISTEHAVPVIERLREGTSHSDVGFTGFDLGDLTAEDAARIWQDGARHPQAFAEAGLPALVVSDVESGSPAEAAGIVERDVVTTMAGQPVSSFAEVCDVLASTNPGETIVVEGVYMEPTATTEIYDPWRVELELGDASTGD